jgi:clan AA aspartic protease (TIGR02281 family)
MLRSILPILLLTCGLLDVAQAQGRRPLGSVAATVRVRRSPPMPSLPPLFLRSFAPEPSRGRAHGGTRLRFQPGQPSILGRAVVNDTAAGTFVIDTGATSVSLTRRFAQRLGLDLSRARAVPIQTASGNDVALHTRVARIDLGGAIAEDLDVTILNGDLGEADGLLGLSFLGRFKMTLDPKKGHLELESASGR